MVAKNQFDADDARLSAYALGELDESERASVEQLLATDPEARKFVDELRATARALESELANEKMPELTAAQRDGIVGRAQSKRRHRTPMRAWFSYAIAAAAVTSFVSWAALTIVQSHSVDKERMAVKLGDPAASSAHGRAAQDQLRGLGYLGDSDGSPAAKAAQQPQGQMVYELQRLGYSGGSAAQGATGGTPIGVGRVGHKGTATSAFTSRRAAPLLQRAGDSFSQRLVGLDEDESNTEAYDALVENAFKLSRDDALSTFSIDVDTASYSNVRRFLNQGQLPPPDAVRIEELVNYFRYAYPPATGADPFSTSTEVATCPWQKDHLLVRIGLRGRDIPAYERPASNLVFLIDVSGSMDEPNKLPLLVRSMKLLVEQLDARDRVAMVVYAGNSGLVLPSTNCGNKAVIVAALDSLQAGGSTNGGAGIELAYKVARENLIGGGTNRVILCTDGDFNVGTTSQDQLVKLIEDERKSGVLLSVLGYGTGNVKDSTMEKLADKGNGSYGYIDDINEARKLLVEEIGGSLVTIAKDVKIQVEFNPALVQAWRLIGYENRVLAHQDFNDDKKDAGEIGAGTTVTALYELVPVGVPFTAPSVDPSRYQPPTEKASTAFDGELMFLKLRYKEPTSDASKLLSTPIANAHVEWKDASEDFRFASAVAAFGMKLRQSALIGDLSLVDIARMATNARGRDEAGYRNEFLRLVERAQQLKWPGNDKLQVLGYGGEDKR
jgi:Ca-activated chloride channel family protein